MQMMQDTLCFTLTHTHTHTHITMDDDYEDHTDGYGYAGGLER